MKFMYLADLDAPFFVCALKNLFAPGVFYASLATSRFDGDDSARKGEKNRRRGGISHNGTFLQRLFIIREYQTKKGQAAFTCDLPVLLQH